MADIIAGDVRMIRRIIGLASRLPRLRSLPIREATEEVCSGLLRQVDFGREMRTLKRFMALFADCDEATVPEVIEAKCTDEVIVMQYLSGYAPVVVRRNIKEDREAVRSGLRALYRMIFEAGLVHCDMHAGNILRGADGRVALIDFGFVAEMEPVAKHEFARFFIAIIFRNGPMAADSVRRTARHVARWHDPLAFEDDMQRLVDSVGGKKASEFQVARFVYELFELQRSHGIYGSPDFTLPILSLLAYEGMIKELYPDLDFQQEAVPFIMACLAEPSQPVVPGGQGSVLDRMSNGRAMPHQAAIPPVVDS